MEKIVYLDNGATTMVDPKVIEIMLPYMTKHYGNPASTHQIGEEAREAIEKARSVIAKSIGAKSSEIFFTSGGTESNNWALKSVAFKNKDKGKHIITTEIEHKCVLNSCKWLKEMGYEITYLKVDDEGFIDINALKNAIRKDTVLVSVIHGNNEIGTIQNLKEIGKLCKENGVYFHTDACQSYTKTELNVKKQNLDLVTLNAHKLHGPKGVGALYIRSGTNINAWQHGGEQEKNMRSGTVNVPGVVGFAEAVKLGMNHKHVEYMRRLRDKLIEGVLDIEDVRLNGPTGENRLCNNANFSFKGIEGEALGGYLDSKGICSSTGSACSARTLAPSHVLKAIGLTDEEANGSIRLTVSRFTTDEEIDYALDVLPGVVKKLRSFSPIGKGLDKVIKHVFKKSD